MRLRRIGYAYEWSGDRWRRFWQTEQDDYAEKKYFPQRFEEVLISPTDDRPEGDKSVHLILTLGVEPWCSSNWHDIYMRVWRTKAGVAEPKLLLDERAWGDVAARIDGTVSESHVLAEYSVGLSPGFTRRLVRHYVVDGDKISRVDPVALGPRDFVDATGWRVRAGRKRAIGRRSACGTGKVLPSISRTPPRCIAGNRRTSGRW